MMIYKNDFIYSWGMKEKSNLIEKQRNHISRILSASGLSLTELARQSEIASTTLTRWYNGSPKHALSAITFEKITARYPIETEKSHLSEADVAIVYVLKAVIGLLTRYKVISSSELRDEFNHAVGLYQTHHLQEAEKVMEGFRMFVGGGTPSKETEALHKLLEIAPRGSA